MGRPLSGSFRASFLAVVLVGLIVGLCGCTGEGLDESDAGGSGRPGADADRSADSAQVSESQQRSEPTRTMAEATVPPDAEDSSSDSVPAAGSTSSTRLVTTTSTLSPTTTVSLREEEGEPAGGLIAFLRGEGFSSDGSDRPPEVSDGRDAALELMAQQVFQAHCGFEIFVMNGDGSSVRQVTENTTRVTPPVWSPDGSRFLYVDIGLLGFEEQGCDQEGAVQSPPGVFVVDAETLTSRLVTPTGLFVYYVLDVGALVWSPDGSRFGFVGAIGNGDDVSDEGLYVVEADGSGLRLLVPIPDVADGTEWSWAPDGSAIAFVRLDLAEADSEMFVVNVETGTIRRLTDNNRINSSPVWSNDGSQIVYLSSSSDWDSFPPANEIYVTDSDGTGERQLTDLGAILYDLRWAPDGSGIYFRYAQADNPWSSFHDIFKVPIDGSPAVQLTDLRGRLADIDEEQRSFAEILSLLVWAPDSSRIALTTVSDEALHAEQPFPDSISIVDIAQRHTRELATRIGPIFDLTWSPDSSKLLVVSTTISTWNLEIYALDVTDGTIDRLTDYDGSDSRPAWAQRTK